MQMERALVMDPSDNVATAISELRPGETVSVLIGAERIDVEIFDKVPFGHKFAIRELGKGEHVVKFGRSIGASTEIINLGQHVHTHNLKSSRVQIK